MPSGLKDTLRKVFGGKRQAVSAKKVLSNQATLKNPYGKSAGVATHQRIAEAELAAQSKQAQKKAAK